MSVPNATSFSLQDVTKEIYGSTVITGNLKQCFIDAIGTFDPAYVGSKNSLLNFRNYANIIPLGYGRLYNAYAALNSNNIAPNGWHVPSDAEFETLVNYLGGYSVSGGHLKESGSIHWANNDLVSDNSSGFTDIGPGSRLRTGVFNGLSISSTYYASDALTKDTFLSHGAGGHNSYRYTGATANCGFSVRCIKDDSTNTGNVADIEGRIYNTVKIGTQVWMASNLKTTKYRNGVAIPIVTDATAWSKLTTDACCSYNNDNNNL